MGKEVNIESIRALEGQIEEGKGDIIKLRRARNLLLNISARVPPEILGDIFSWTLARPDPALDLDSHFDGFYKGCYNFLLVCHHWFEVASRTPELWGFWGNAMEEWKRWHHRHPRGMPLDLVLANYGGASDAGAFLDSTLESKLREFASRDSIRQVHIQSYNPRLLPSLISTLIPNCDGAHHRSIESIHLENRGFPLLDVSSFFNRVHLPKLRSLLVFGVSGVPWDHLSKQTTLLTTLSFRFSRTRPSPPPTIPQLFGILNSNPGLRDLYFDGPATPEHNVDGSVPQITLPRLKWLCLTGKFHDVFRLLNQLVFPHPLELIWLIPYIRSTDGILEVLGPYMRHYFQRHHELQVRLCIKTRIFLRRLLIRIDTEETSHNDNSFWVNLKMYPTQNLPGALQNLCHDLIAFTPQERACSFDTDIPTDRLEALLVAMPNIETLRLRNVALSEGFLRPNPTGPYSKTRLLPSLCTLHLENVTLSNDDWRHLTVFLVHQSSDGQAIRLTITGHIPCICPHTAEEIRDLVQEFTFGGFFGAGTHCPTGRCGDGT